jgi:hypothetical protein
MKRRYLYVGKDLAIVMRQFCCNMSYGEIVQNECFVHWGLLWVCFNYKRNTKGAPFSL